MPATASISTRAVLDRYCVTCHNRRLKTAGLTLDTMDLADVGTGADVWEKVVRKLRAGAMPPAGRPRPDRPTYDAVISWLETELDRAASRNPNPGRTEPIHRLNRAEYQNAIRDLVALDMDMASDLPADDGSYGFDNIASALKISPTLMDGYLVAAEKIGRLAIGASAPLEVKTFRLSDELSQDHHVEGLPFGTRGGTLIRFTFPKDGEYLLSVQLARWGVNGNGEHIPTFDQPQLLEITLDGERLQVFTLPRAERPEDQRGLDRRDLDAGWQVRFAAKAGPREIGVTFLNNTSPLLETLIAPLRPYAGGSTGFYSARKGAYLRSVEITGPFNAAVVDDTPSRRRIFVCRPASPSAEAACARTILSTLARRAYRRPVTETDIQGLFDFYNSGQAEGGFEAGIEMALRALLVSPEFLFRIERDPAQIAANTTYRINDVELAARLSFFLWSSIPDDELLDLAAKGKLRNPAILEQQVRRMLADPKLEGLVANFTGQWLMLRNVPGVRPDPWKDPDFDENLRQAFRRETELFFESVIREDRSAQDLLTADYTFVNERLARHYGIPNVYGSAFRRVRLTDENRRGLLGQGSLLSVTSQPTRTSPVSRGKWILENILGTPPPSPPPNVPPFPEEEGKEPASVRAKLEQHRANPVCATCHATMDPLGFALENFDLVGRWRARDESAGAIDASGTLSDGTPFNGPVEMRRALLSRGDQFVATLTEKLLTYALGRGIEHYDAPAIRAITRDAARDNYRMASSLILGIVKSVPFQMRRSQS
jgi:hypothetical protein